MKKLLLGLGTLASVAAPVAAVVACGSTTPVKAATPTETDDYAAANAKIAAVISSISDTPFAASVAAETGFFSELTKESQLNREIKVVSNGLIVEFENDTTDGILKMYFPEGTSTEEINAELAKVNANEDKYFAETGHYAQGANQKIKSQREITSPMVVYYDAAGHGFHNIFSPAEFATHAPFLKMETPVFNSIKEIVAKTLAPKPVVAPSSGATLTATSTLTMAQFKDAIANDSTPADHNHLESELQITLPSSISVDHIYEIDIKDESGKTITLTVKQGTSIMSTDTDIIITTA